MAKIKKWIIPRGNDAETNALSRNLRLTPITARVLINRGLSDADSAREFMQPSLHRLIDPCCDENVRAAARFLKDAVKTRKKITIYGDFDADGICATAVMVRILRAVGASVDFYVPQRFEEGYGLNMPALEDIKKKGADIVVTVDCGISDNEAVRHASNIGLELIITDHHQQRGELPPAAYLLNPHLESCKFGYENLSGVGVAFKLAWAIGQSFGSAGAVSPALKDTLVDLLPLVAIGTVADIVPMESENRIYVNYGLRLFSSASLPGLRALMETCGIAGKSRFSTYNIGYQIAPRLNAVGRMSDAGAAIEMLITDRPEKASKIAADLENHNRKRQSIQRTISDEALLLAEESHDTENCSCIVLSSPQWHPGVIGLVASRVAEHFSLPAFVFYEADGVARGSARSIEGLHLFDAVSRCGDILSRFGGHEGAAGLTLPVENMGLFKKTIAEVTCDMMGTERAMPGLRLEGEIELSDLTKPAVDELDYLEPYGEGNPKPLFAAHNLKIAGNPQLVGSRRNHLNFFVKQADNALRVIAFGKADWLETMGRRKNELFSLAFEPQINTFNGKYDVELRAEDIQWKGSSLIEHK